MSTFHTNRTDVSFPDRERRSHANSPLLSVAMMLEGMMRRHRSRRALMGLSDDLLKDIGVSRSEAFEEASRPFWKK